MTAAEHEHSLLREVAAGTVRLERSNELWRVGIPGGVVVFVLLAVFILLGLAAEAVPVAVGALFVPLAGSAEAIGRRLISQAWLMAWIMLATLLGALASQPGLTALAFGVVLAPFVAFACGFGGGAGPTARLISTVSLVCYAIFMGMPDTPVGAVRSCLLVGLGGIAQMAVVAGLHLVQRRSNAWRAAPVSSSVLDRLRARWSPRDDFIRHGVRLALAFTVATVISQLLTWPHQYWIPMTVAWVAVPDATGTATKVFARLAGTLIGLAAVTPVLELLKPGPVGVALLVALGTLLAQVYIAANYSVCVAGVTIFVMALFTLLGDPVGPSVVFRIVDTVMAGVIAVGFSLVWPSVEHEHRHRFTRRPRPAGG